MICPYRPYLIICVERPWLAEERIPLEIQLVRVINTQVANTLILKRMLKNFNHFMYVLKWFLDAEHLYYRPLPFLSSLNGSTTLQHDPSCTAVSSFSFFSENIEYL